MAKHKSSKSNLSTSTLSKLTSKVKLINSRGTDTICIAANGKDVDLDDLQGGSMEDAAKVISEVKYLVPDWIPFGMVTMLFSEPGVGKSAFALYGLVRPVVQACDWFNGTKGPKKPGYAIWCDTENSVAINVGRIRKWKIPAARIKTLFSDPLQQVNLESSDDCELLERTIRKWKAKLVVIDSMRGSHSGDENNSRVVKALQSLAQIAERTGAAIILIHHTYKLKLDEDLTANSSRGSNAIIGMVRSQLGVEKPDPNSEWKKLSMFKENLGIKPSPIGYLITNDGIEFGSAPEKPKKLRKQSEASLVESWLKEKLQPGKTYKSGRVIEEAESLGYSKRVVQRAARSIGVITSPVYKEGKISHHNWAVSK